MSIDRATAKIVHADLDAALAAVGLKHGMSIKSGTFRFDSSVGSFSLNVTGLKLEAAEVGDARLLATKPDYITRAKELGFFGKTVTYAGKSYEIIGHNGYVLLGWDPRKKSGVRFNQAQTSQVMPQLRTAPGVAAPGSFGMANALTITPVPKGQLAKFIDERNSIRRALNKPLYRADALTAQDKIELADSLAGALSPENLACDGEASAAHIRTRGAYLNSAARELEAMGGPKVYEF
jgi:hypothetical protein